MDFLLSPAQKSLRDSFRAFAQNERPALLRPGRGDDRAREAMCARLSSLGSFEPGPVSSPPNRESVVMDAVVVIEELARTAPCLASALVEHNFFFRRHMMDFGRPGQGEKFLACPARNADLGSWCPAPAAALAGHRHLPTRAERRAGAWVVNGSQVVMNSAPPAEWMIITAVTDASRAGEGVSAFILKRSMPGLFPEAALRSKRRSDPASERLVLRDVVVPEANMVGEEGQGLRSARRVLEAGRIYWAAASLGLAEAALETGFGLGEAKDISVKAPDSRGRIQGALAERIVDLQAAKIQDYRAALRNDRGLDTIRETSSAAARAADLVLKSVALSARFKLKAGRPRNTAAEFKRGAAAVERWRIIEKILAND